MPSENFPSISVFINAIYQFCRLKIRLFPMSYLPYLKKLLRRFRIMLRRATGRKAKTAWISHPDFMQHEPGIRHPESPDRIRAIEDALEVQQVWRRLQIFEAKEIQDAQLALVHPRKYLSNLEANQPPEGKIYRIDDDTVMSHQSLHAARFGAGAVVKAVNLVMRKRAYNAFCAIRPPGHHAESSKSSGFCLLNNVAVGAMHAIAEHRLNKIAVIDFDAHFGDGTLEIFQNDPRILFLNCYETGLFPFPAAEQTAASANAVHLPLAPKTDSRAFREAVRKYWLPKLAAFKPECVLLSAGFDAHKQDETSHLNLHEADYSWLTHKIVQTASSCKGRIVSVLEGGYTLEPLAKSSAAHIRALCGMPRAAYVAKYDRRIEHSRKPPRLTP